MNASGKIPRDVTIDADLENDPKHIPRLLEQIGRFDVVVASRTEIPRISEKFASKTLGKLVSVTESFSNFRLTEKKSCQC
jgi:dolichol-phosphate mannosyltransferase